MNGRGTEADDSVERGLYAREIYIGLLKGQEGTCFGKFQIVGFYCKRLVLSLILFGMKRSFI